MLLQSGLVVALLPVCCFAPGFYFVRRFRWLPVEKLCGSIGLSLILLYLASWGIYGLPRRFGVPAVYPAAVVSLVCAAMALASWKDIRSLAGAVSVRRGLAAFGVLLIWTTLLLAIIRNYSGAGWAGDWLEHFQRSLFFLRHFPAQTLFFGDYELPARPPMMNLLAAFFLAQSSDRFELFQLVFTFLNLLVFLPCYLIMPAFGRQAKRRTWLLLLLFAASPVVMENTTYSWTKAGAAFYVVLAIWFYLAGWRKRDSRRTAAAFVALTAGLLVHYSAAPYAIVLALHYVACVFPRRRRKWRELASIAVSCGLLFATWLVWSIEVYGVRASFASNTTVTLGQGYEGSAAEKVAGNLYNTIVPVLVRDPSLMQAFEQPSLAGKLRDTAFLFYQVNAIFGMGLTGGPLILFLLYRTVRRRPVTTEGRFWLMLILGSVLLGVAVVGERDYFGSAHLTLFSLQVMGLSMLASLAPLRRRFFTILLLAGCTVDFSLGVLLHARVESLENTAATTPFPGVTFANGSIRKSPPGPDAISQAARRNWFAKHQLASVLGIFQTFEDRYGDDPAYQPEWPRITAEVARARKDDADNWQGWFARHGGQVTYLGDHAAGASGFGTNVATVLLVILFGGLVALFWRTRDTL